MASSFRGQTADRAHSQPTRAAHGSVHEHVGGLADIEARRVRCIGDPARRIKEDFLRILRFFRIHAAYGQGEPDRDAVEACIAARDGLASLSAERLRMEMLKLVVAKGAAEALGEMDDGGLVGAITAGVSYHGPIANMVEAERMLGIAAAALSRLGALTVATPEDATRLSERLRLSNAETRRQESMGHRWWRMRDMDEEVARRRVYRLGPDRYTERVLLA